VGYEERNLARLGWARREGAVRERTADLLRATPPSRELGLGDHVVVDAGGSFEPAEHGPEPAAEQWRPPFAQPPAPARTG
jgi:hypothetical protein